MTKIDIWFFTEHNEEFKLDDIIVPAVGQHFIFSHASNKTWIEQECIPESIIGKTLEVTKVENVFYANDQLRLEQHVRVYLMEKLAHGLL